MSNFPPAEPPSLARPPPPPPLPYRLKYSASHERERQEPVGDGEGEGMASVGGSSDVLGAGSATEGFMRELT